MSKRFFLVAYTYAKNGQMGTGNLWFSHNGFPSMSFLKEGASDASQAHMSNIVIFNIQEFSQDDFEALKA